MAEIKILSPVHIGTGIQNETPSYHVCNTVASYYEFSDILFQIPRDVYSNGDILEKIYLSRLKNQRNRPLYSLISKYVDYSKLNEKYTLDYCLDYDMQEYPYDVSQQIKDLGKPYIPGSTIKGSLMNMWIYYLLKNQSSLTENKMRNFLEGFRQQGVARHYQRNIFELIFEKEESKVIDSFIADLRGCLLCRDLYFEKMQIYQSDRIGTGKDGKGEMPLSYKECISPNQIINQRLFAIDSEKLKIITSKYGNSAGLCSILKYFTLSHIIRAADIFMKDTLRVEMEKVDMYQGYSNISLQLKEYLDILNISSKDKKHILLRVGNSTNYFYKTISLLVANQYPNLYREYFTDVFSPVTAKNAKVKPKSHTMPKTRVVYSNKDGYVLPGYIMVTYDKKS